MYFMCRFDVLLDSLGSASWWFPPSVLRNLFHLICDCGGLALLTKAAKENAGVRARIPLCVGVCGYSGIWEEGLR